MFAVVAFTRQLEERVKFIQKISSAVVCTLLGITLANVGVIPHTSTTHDAVFTFAIPYAIILVIIGTDMKELMRAGRPMIIAYLFAGLGSFVGGLLGGVVLAGWVGPETWKLSGAFSAAFAGGGMNFAAVGQGLEVDPSTFAAAAVADNLSTVPYLLTQIGLVGVLGGFFARRAKSGAAATHQSSAASDEEADEESTRLRREWTVAEMTSRPRSRNSNATKSAAMPGSPCSAKRMPARNATTWMKSAPNCTAAPNRADL